MFSQCTPFCTQIWVNGSLHEHGLCLSKSPLVYGIPVASYKGISFMGLGTWLITYFRNSYCLMHWKAQMPSLLLGRLRIENTRALFVARSVLKRREINRTHFKDGNCPATSESIQHLEAKFNLYKSLTGETDPINQQI